MELKNNLKFKYDICQKALESLDDAIILLKNTDEISKSKEFLAFQDSVIQRFEYTLDEIWKYVKEYISNKYGIKVKSPKETFREAFKQNIINEQETKLALEMVDDRNETSHKYDMAKAKDISKSIPTYYDFFVKLLEITKYN